MEHDTRTLAVEPAALQFYLDALTRLTRGGIRFLVGGAVAYSQYSGIDRKTKDLDIFLRGNDLSRAFALLEGAGYHTEVPFPHWLGKVWHGPHFIDVIFSSGNGVARVDDLWFEHAVACEILGLPVRLCPPEEMIWTKAFVQERERFDGADVLHLIRALGPTLAWERLLMRFGEHWRVLLSSIVLFGFVYPDQRDRVPRWVREELTRRFNEDREEPARRVCQGTLLSRSQYAFDIDRLGYVDARLEPDGSMTRNEVDVWTAAIDDEPP